MKMEYQQFLEAEATFLRDLGLLKEEEEMLPETDWAPAAGHVTESEFDETSQQALSVSME